MIWHRYTKMNVLGIKVFSLCTHADAVCWSCPPGFYMGATYEATGCVACPSGTYTNLTGSLLCGLCSDCKLASIEPTAAERLGGFVGGALGCLFECKKNSFFPKFLFVRGVL